MDIEYLVAGRNGDRTVSVDIDVSWVITLPLIVRKDGAERSVLLHDLAV